MSKLLLLAIVIAAVWWLAKGFRGKNAAGKATEAVPERMVSCEHCGVYLPLSEAVSDGKRFFCNDEHRQLAG